MKKPSKPSKKNKNNNPQGKNPFNMKGQVAGKGQNIIKRAARGR